MVTPSCAFPSRSPSECSDTVDLILFKIPILMIFCICCWFWQRVVNKFLAWIAYRQILHALMRVLNLTCHSVYIKQFLPGPLSNFLHLWWFCSFSFSLQSLYLFFKDVQLESVYFDNISQWSLCRWVMPSVHIQWCSYNRSLIRRVNLALWLFGRVN